MISSRRSVLAPISFQVGCSDMQFSHYSKTTTSTSWTLSMYNSTCPRCSVSSTRSSRSDKRLLPSPISCAFCFPLIHAIAYEYAHAPSLSGATPRPISTRSLTSLLILVSAHIPSLIHPRSSRDLPRPLTLVTLALCRMICPRAALLALSIPLFLCPKELVSRALS